jgi:hypothetical protein
VGSRRSPAPRPVRPSPRRPDRDVLWILGLAGAGLVIALLLGALSPGTYQDDDLDRFYLARQALQEPVKFLDRWGMPLALILFALPARLAGYAGVEAVSALLTALAAAGVGFAARGVGFRWPWLGTLLVLAQPVVLELSFSALAEPVAAALIGCLLWAWYTERPGLALLLAGLLPLARLETGALTVIVLAAGWSRVGWGPRIGALVPVLLWNLLGFAATGELLYALSGSHGRPLNSLGVLNYARNWIVIGGPSLLFFFGWAVVARFAPAVPEKRDRPERFPALALVLAGSHLMLLSLLAWESLPVGRSIGFLRHVVATAPAAALVALWGVGDWASTAARPRGLRTAFTAIWMAVVFLVLSHRLLAHTLIVDGWEWWRGSVTMVLGGLGVIGLWSRRIVRRDLWLVVAVLGVLAPALITVRPIGLNPERLAIQKIVEAFESEGIASRVVYANHPWFTFLSGRDRYDRTLTPRLTLEALERAPVGSLVLWENHYGHRVFGDVPLEHLADNDRYQLLFRAYGGEPDTFYVYVFAKVR